MKLKLSWMNYEQVALRFAMEEVMAGVKLGFA